MQKWHGGKNQTWVEVRRSVFTFMSSLGDVNNVGNVRCQFGKERNVTGFTHPATDVTHKHRVLVMQTQKHMICQTVHFWEILIVWVCVCVCACTCPQASPMPLSPIPWGQDRFSSSASAPDSWTQNTFLYHRVETYKSSVIILHVL